MRTRIAVLAAIALCLAFTERTEDDALLPIPGAVLSNNIFGKGNITAYHQRIFHDEHATGWEWDWPENTGPAVKTYPEVIIGRSPWSAASAAEILPRHLADVHHTIEFDFATTATGLWLNSFDFWITRADHPTQKDIVANLTIWAQNHGVEPSYKGRHETLEIGGRVYEAIFDTTKAWKTLCLIDKEPRTRGSLELRPLIDALIAHGLAQSTDYLATAEMGTEVPSGKGRTTVRVFSLR